MSGSRTGARAAAGGLASNRWACNMNGKEYLLLTVCCRPARLTRLSSRRGSWCTPSPLSCMPCSWAARRSRGGTCRPSKNSPRGRRSRPAAQTRGRGLVAGASKQALVRDEDVALQACRQGGFQPLPQAPPPSLSHTSHDANDVSPGGWMHGSPCQSHRTSSNWPVPPRLSRRRSAQP
jgi:hypothetical protein